MTTGGIEGLARSLAAELAPAVRVNAIAPSLTDTPLASVLTRSTAMKCVRASVWWIVRFCLLLIPIGIECVVWWFVGFDVKRNNNNREAIAKAHPIPRLGTGGN